MSGPLSAPIAALPLLALAPTIDSQPRLALGADGGAIPPLFTTDSPVTGH